MNNSITALSTGISQPQTPGKDDPEKIREAAVQFEALMITTLLRSAKSDESGGWMGAGEDQTLSPAVGMAEEQLALAIAQQGGMGLSRMILEQLKRASRA